MARPKSKPEQVEEVTIENEGILGAPVEQPSEEVLEVSVTEASEEPKKAIIVKSNKEKMVRARVLKTGSANIGRGFYSFVEKQEVEYPESVAGVLEASGYVTVIS